jgi:hypothetical protein
MEIIDRIRKIPTDRKAGMADVPKDPVIIQSAKRLK